jgi:hypothetical protein
MNHINQLFDSEVITDKIISFLDAKSLARFGATCHKWHALVIESNAYWRRLCKLNNYVKFEYLVETPTHCCIPRKSSSLSLPTYHENDSNNLMLKPCYWREVFNRAEHLLRNWRNGSYYIPPILKAHKGAVSACDANSKIKIFLSFLI